MARAEANTFLAEYGAEMMKDFAREWHGAPGAAKAALLVRLTAESAISSQDGNQST